MLPNLVKKWLNLLAVLKYNANVKYNASGNTTLASSVEMFNLLVTTLLGCTQYVFWVCLFESLCECRQKNRLCHLLNERHALSQLTRVIFDPRLVTCTPPLKANGPGELATH